MCVHTSPPSTSPPTSPSHPTSPPHPTPLGFHRALSGAPCDIQKLSTGCLFYSSLLWQWIYVNTNLPVHPTLRSPAHRVYTSVLHVCVSILALQILLSHKKERNRIIWSDVDEQPRVCHSEWSKSEREKQILYQFSSVAQSRPPFWDPMDCSMPGLPVHHQLLEFTQTHVHWVGDAIQTSHPLSSPSPPAFDLSQHQGLFQWVSSSHQVAKVLEFQLQHQSFQWTFRTDLLILTYICGI